MQKINKETEPPPLIVWREKNQNTKYQDLQKTTEGQELRTLIREYALQEQFYLCAYCCQQIRDIDSCHNEHIEPQDKSPQRTLDFTNIVVSCNTPKQCGNAHGSQHLPLTNSR